MRGVRINGTPRPPLGKIDWFLARGLACTEPATVAAVDHDGTARHRLGYRYDPAAIEPRWQERWEELGLHATDLEDTERAISALHLDGHDRLWVQHSRSDRHQREGVFLTLDLYDRAGQWQREVSLVCEGRPVSDGIRFLGDGRVLLIKGFVVARLACLGSGVATLGEDETEVIEIVCYRLPEV